MRASTFRAWYAVHKWTSLVCTVFLLLLCLTGLPLVFGHEIDHWLGEGVEAPEPAPAQASASASIDALLADARAHKPGMAVRFVTHDDQEPLWFVSLSPTASPRGGALLTYDARTGERLHEGPLRSAFSQLMFKLHTDLFAGLAGALFLGAMGLLFVVATVSGAVVYGPYMKRLPFATVRHERSARLRWLDLHNLMGIATLAWALVVGLTGVLLTLSKPIYAYWQSTELAEMVAPHAALGPASTLGSLDAAVARAQAEEPDMTVAFVAFPGTPLAGPRHYAVFMRGLAHAESRLIKPVLIDAGTGALVDQRDMPWYVAALRLSGPLHYGDYAGWPMQWLWALLDLVLIVVLGSGLYLWWRRRAAPRAPTARGAEAPAP
jgi:uncharacterized iron-regulated membrane protein